MERVRDWRPDFNYTPVEPVAGCVRHAASSTPRCSDVSRKTFLRPPSFCLRTLRLHYRNYYPVPAAIATVDTSRGIGLSVSTDRSEGGSSIFDGSLGEGGLHSASTVSDAALAYPSPQQSSWCIAASSTTTVGGSASR
jgi:hypothetical protein